MARITDYRYRRAGARYRDQESYQPQRKVTEGLYDEQEEELNDEFEFCLPEGSNDGHGVTRDTDTDTATVRLTPASESSPTNRLPSCNHNESTGQHKVSTVSPAASHNVVSQAPNKSNDTSTKPQKAATEGTQSRHSIKQRRRRRIPRPNTDAFSNSATRDRNPSTADASMYSVDHSVAASMTNAVRAICSVTPIFTVGSGRKMATNEDSPPREAFSAATVNTTHLDDVDDREDDSFPPTMDLVQDSVDPIRRSPSESLKQHLALRTNPVIPLETPDVRFSQLDESSSHALNNTTTPCRVRFPFESQQPLATVDTPQPIKQLLNGRKFSRPCDERAQRDRLLPTKAWMAQNRRPHTTIACAGERKSTKKRAKLFVQNFD